MLDSPQREPPRDPEALQREMESVRSDMAKALEQLNLAVRWRFDIRRQLKVHPLVSLAVVTATGLGVVFGVRRFLQTRRIRRTLGKLSAARGRHILIF
jgi:hypothetical protein